MTNFFKAVGLAAIVGSGLWLATAAQAGGDAPFPLLGDTEEIELAEVWATMDDNQELRLYKSESGETFLVLETQRPRKKIEILRRVK
jgi:hypothetical protein